MNNNIFWTLVIFLLVVAIAGVAYFAWQVDQQKPSTAVTTTTATGNEVTFLCDQGKSIMATFYPSNDTHVDLVLSDGRTLSVPHAVSADGARYATTNGSFVFWNVGNTATITENGQTTYANCAVSGTATTPPAQSVSDGTITFTYDSNFGLATTPSQVTVTSYIPPCDSDFNYCLYYNANTYAGTNFESAGLRIEKRTDLTTQSACLQTAPTGFDSSLKPNGTNTANASYATSVFSNVGQGAAGHLSSGMLYRLFVASNSSCYEFETRVGQTEFGNYPPGAIKEFTDADNQQVQVQLLNVVQGITLKGNQLVQFPQ